MSMKSRLFASVAAPVLSLPLLIQPANALPSGLDVAPARVVTSDIIRVQQQILPEDGKPGEGKEKPKRDKQQSDGERPQKREQQADQGGAEQQPKRRQTQDAGEGQQPQKREQQADQGGADQQPKRRQPQADQAEQPQRKPKPDQAEAPQQPKQQKQNAEQAPDAKPQPKASAQQAEQPQQAPKPPRQKADQGNSDQPANPARQTEQTQQPAKPQQKQNAEQAPDAKPQPKTDAQQAEQPQQAPKPSRQKADQKDADQPATQPDQAQQPSKSRQQNAEQAPDARPPKRRDPQQAEQPQQQPAQAGQAQQDQPKPGQANTGKPPVNQQAGQGADQQPGNARPAQPPQTAKTPEQVERAKEIARDPKAAKPGEQAVLPVENGAAVLDSAKQQNRRPRGDGRNQPDQQGQQGQFGQQGGQQSGQTGRPSRNQIPDQPPGPPPRSDADAQGPGMSRQQEQQALRAVDQERGKRLDKRPKFERQNGWEVLGAAAIGAAVGYAVGQGQNQGNQAPPPPGYGDRDDGRVFMRIDDQEVIRHDDSRRFYDDRRPPEYDQLAEGRVREVIVREDGTRIVTLRNRYGEVVQRSRIGRDGQEYILSYAPQLMNETRGADYVWRDPGDDLPPMRLDVPLDDYIADTSAEPDRDYYRFLEKPPVERVERVYSLDEVRYSARLRDKVRRIDLDTITFDTASATISMDQAGSLRNVADGIKQVLDKDPSETFLIEGHTDAVGADQDNLVLSDQRAESVARVLTDVYGIPPENMATQGYGEQFLKVQMQGPNQENRRVTIRRITPLVKPIASK